MMRNENIEAKDKKRSRRKVTQNMSEDFVNSIDCAHQGLLNSTYRSLPVYEHEQRVHRSSTYVILKSNLKF